MYKRQAVQSTIEKSNAFTSGEKNSTDDSEDPAENSFSEDSESSSVDFDNAYPVSYTHLKMAWINPKSLRL